MGYFQGFPGDPLRPIDRHSRFEFSNANVAAPVGTTMVAQIGVMTIFRAVRLPKASSAPAGTRVLVVDESGSVNTTNFLAVQMASNSGDTFFNTSSTQYVISKAGGWVEVETDGVSKWIVVSEYAQQSMDLFHPTVLGATVAGPESSFSNFTLTAATQFFFKVPIPRPITSVNIRYSVAIAAVTFTNAFVAWYDSSGTMILQSATQTGVWNTTGFKTLAFAVTPVWTGPTTFGWVMFYTGTATTPPQFVGGGFAGGADAGNSSNVGTTASTRRAGTIALASTATMPNITPSSMALTGGIFAAYLTT